MSEFKSKFDWRAALLGAVTIGLVAFCVIEYRHYAAGMENPTVRSNRPEASVFKDETGVKASTSPPVESAHDSASLTVPPSKGEIKSMRERVLSELDLSWKQMWQIARLRSGGPPQSPEDLATRLNEMQAVLTPEQRSKAADLLQQGLHRTLSRRLEKASRVLPPDQYSIFQQRLMHRLTEFRSRLDNPYQRDNP